MIALTTQLHTFEFQATVPTQSHLRMNLALVVCTATLLSTSVTFNLLHKYECETNQSDSAEITSSAPLDTSSLVVNLPKLNRIEESASSPLRPKARST